MKHGFYPHLAADGIRKNRQLYLPYLFTQAGMVMMLYIILFLPKSPAVQAMNGSRTISSMLYFGGWVMALFACIFLFYTNSFLIRRRKKEFGLYNMLGMGKRNIGVILFWETLLNYALSLAAGLVLGFAFSKLAELGLIRLMGGKTDFNLSVSGEAVVMTALAFGVISILLLINSLTQVRLSSAVALMRSEHQGEKPPRANWVLGLLGVVLLGYAYYISLTIQDPVAALGWFFVAVILVILATYLLMVTGSVLLCRVLQKNKRYYYRPEHFVSVSSMAYRMKRNGAGLASICILCTMALVTISTTTCLYSGAEASLQGRYPRELLTSVDSYRHAYEGDPYPAELQPLDEALLSQVQETVWSAAGQYGVIPQNVLTYRYLYTGARLEGDALSFSSFSAQECCLYFIPLRDYNAATGSRQTLDEDELLLYPFRTGYSGRTISVEVLGQLRVKEILSDFPVPGSAASSIIPSVILIVPELEPLRTALQNSMKCGALSLHWDFGFDTGLDSTGQEALHAILYDRVSDQMLDTGYSFSVECRAINRSDFYSSYGSLLFLGILLSAVFLLAAVLIIYYKQISEGYEDHVRFDIMQKVGMTRAEIRKSVNSQLLTVFFLPLLGAGMHLAFAFPIVRKLLLLFGLNNAPLFAATSCISFAVFTLFYVLVYRITSNAYYKLVSGARPD